jgi:hypothetical protein
MFNIGSDIEFMYNSTTLKKAFLESGSNMLSIPVGQEGYPNIESYSELFPFFEDNGELVTDDMWNRLFSSALSNVNLVINKLVADNYSTTGQFTIDSDIVIPIKGAEYNEADLTVADNAIFDALVYGAVAEWYTNTNVEALVTLSKNRAAESMSKLIAVVKRLEGVLLRKRLNSPIFDSMI